MLRSMLVSIVIFCGASCKQSMQLDENKKKAIVDEVREMLNNYYADIKSSGLTAEFRYLDNSPGFFWVPPGYRSSIPYDSVAAILKQNAPMYRSIDNTFDKIYISPLSETIASYTGQLRSSMTDVSGKTTVFFMVETGVLIKRNDGWKLLCGQTAIIN